MLWEAILEAGQQRTFSNAANVMHIIAIIILFSKINKSQSCKGVSLHSQILYMIVFFSRYLDLTTNFISCYNTGIKVVLILFSSATVFLMFKNYKEPWKKNHEVITLDQLILPAFTLALLTTAKFTIMEIMWTFSIYLEVIAILPQLYMIYRKNSIDTMTFWYLFFLGSYRAVYAFHYYLRYCNEGFVDIIAFNSAIVQSVVFVSFFIFLAENKLQQKFMYELVPVKTVDSCLKN